jgi:Tol biopolymer transport system component
MGWAPDGDHILFGSDRSGTPGAWLLPLTDGEPGGAPWLVKPDMWRVTPVGFTHDGRFFYNVRTGKRDIYVATFDPESKTVVGSPTALTARSVGNSRHAFWSPDGRHLAYIQERGFAPGSGSRTVVAIRSMETGQVRELDLGLTGSFSSPRWLSDGRSIRVTVWNPNDADTVEFYRVDVQTGSTHVLGAGGQPSPDGQWVFYSRADQNPEGQAAFRVMRKHLATGDTTSLFQTPYGPWGQISGMRLSPDGQTLAFGYGPEGPDRLVLLPVDGGEPRELALPNIGWPGPTRIAWMPDGNALLLWRHPEVWHVDLDMGEAEAIGLSIAGGRGIHLDMHPDGRRIAYTDGTESTELWVMENFLPTDASER